MCFKQIFFFLCHLLKIIPRNVDRSKIGVVKTKDRKKRMIRGVKAVTISDFGVKNR
jgi:hypothetical protein